jgi:ADP-ribosylglycohydrolase
MNKKIKNSILASLTADAYLLGSHWVYDEEQLKNLPIEWETLNAPQAMWHKGKNKGDFTHYGDQTFFLLEYMALKKKFDKMDFYSFWSEKMSTYSGYIDGATRNALVSMDSASNDLSICGRLAPLLLGCNSKESFLSDVKNLVEITHNSELAKITSRFFAELLWDSKENQEIQSNIQNLKGKYLLLEQWINAGVESKNSDTINSIRAFGPACGIDGGFAGVIHLLSLEDDFKTVMQKNAKAGGDSSARGMVVAMILGAQDDCIAHEEWMNEMNLLKEIREHIDANI